MWVLSQARSVIDPRKMPESTLTMVTQWDCRVNINQQERWLIDPLLPDSPSLLRLIMPCFHAPPSLSPQPLWACLDLATLLQMYPNWIKIQESIEYRLQLTPGIRMHLSCKPAKTENTSFLTLFWPCSVTEPRPETELFKKADCCLTLCEATMCCHWFQPSQWHCFFFCFVFVVFF